MARKTIDVEKVKAKVNEVLAINDSEGLTEDMKKGIAWLMAHILLETGNYKGFNYNEWIKRGGYERYLEAKKTNKDVDPSDFMGEEYDRFYY